MGCRETLEVERGLTEFVCPDCATPQSLPPELMPPPPPRRRALPLPRSVADARGARLPCGACGELLSVPVGLSRCACPFCGAELAVDSARIRNYILYSAEAAAMPLPAVVAPSIGAWEAHQGRPSLSVRAGAPRAELHDRLIPLERTRTERSDRLKHVHQDGHDYPDHMIDGEEMHVVDEATANNSPQRNRFPLDRGIACSENRQTLSLNAVRHQVNDQHSSYTTQPKRSQLARLHRVVHSEEMQEGPLSHEVYREARHTELIYQTAATHRNQIVGCSVGPQTLSAGKRHIETPNHIMQQPHKHPYHDSHAEGTHVGCLDGVIYAHDVQPDPVNQANHREETSTQMIDKTIVGKNIWSAGCSVGPSSGSAKRKASTANKVTRHKQKQQSDANHAEHTHNEHPDQEICEPMSNTNHKEAMCSLPSKETTARRSKQKNSPLLNAKTIAKKRHIEPVNHIIQQAEGHTSDIDSHEMQADCEHQSKGIGRHDKHKTRSELYSTLTPKVGEHLVSPNKLNDVKQKHVRTNDEIQEKHTEVEVCKQASGGTQKTNRKGSMANSIVGLQLRRSSRLAKDSIAAVQNKHVESDSVNPRVFSPAVQMPAVSMDSEPIEREPVQQSYASPSREVPVAVTDPESEESEHDEQYDVSPDQSMSESDPPDIDRIIADLNPSTSPVREMPQEMSNERDDLTTTPSNDDMSDPEPDDLTTTPSNTDMSDPEHFARRYCLLLLQEARRAFAKVKPNVFLHRLMSEGSNDVPLHDLTDSGEQQQGLEGNQAGGRGPTRCAKVWILPEGVRLPVSLNNSGLPIGKNAAMFITFLGTLARDGMLAPLTYQSWKSIPKENKNVLWHIVKLKFDVDPPCELSVLKCIRKTWRCWKSHLKRKHYDSHTTEEERLADRDPRVLKEQWRQLVAYWNTEKAKVRSAKSKASRAKSTYINSTGSKSFARMFQEESPSHENRAGSGSDSASAMGAKGKGITDSYKPLASPKDLQGRLTRQAERAKKKVADEGSTLRKEVVVMEKSHPKDSQERAVWEAVRAKRRAEDEAVALRKKVVVMEETQKKLQEDLAKMTDTVNAMQKMMSTGGLPNGLMGGPTVPPSFQQDRNAASSHDVFPPYIDYSGPTRSFLP